MNVTIDSVGSSATRLLILYFIYQSDVTSFSLSLFIFRVRVSIFLELGLGLYLVLWLGLFFGEGKR